MKNKKSTEGLKITLSFVDVPINIAKTFREDIRGKYGNIYWVKLMDLMRKAEAYDYLISQQGYVEDMDIPEENIEKDKYGKPVQKDEEENVIRTFTKEIKVD